MALPLIVLLILSGVFGNTASAPGQPVFYRGAGPMSYYVPAYLCPVRVGVRDRSASRPTWPATANGACSSVIGLPRIWVIAGSEVIVAFALSAASAAVLLVAARLVYDFASPSALLGVIAVFCYLTVALWARLRRASSPRAGPPECSENPDPPVTGRQLNAELLFAAIDWSSLPPKSSTSRSDASGNPDGVPLLVIRQ